MTASDEEQRASITARLIDDLGVATLEEINVQLEEVNADWPDADRLIRFPTLEAAVQAANSNQPGLTLSGSVFVVDGAHAVIED